MDNRSDRLAPIRDARALGHALKIYRRRDNIRQAQLAERLGTYRPNISRIENGHAVEQLDLLFSMIRELGLEIRLEPQTRRA